MWSNVNIVSTIVFVSVLSFLIAPKHAVADHTPHLFPKRANYFLHWSISDSTARELAKWDLVILDMETQLTSRRQLDLIRQLNPDIVMLVYLTSQEIRRDADLGSSRMRQKLWEKIDPRWYVVNTNNQRQSFWPGTWLLNMSTSAPTIQGKKMNKVMAEFVSTELLSTGLWDGVFYDNTFDSITWITGPQVDLDLNGQADTAPDAAWIAGMKFLYNETRQLTNNQYVIVGNGTTRAYRNELNGQMIENFLPAAWTPTMQTYEFLHNGGPGPRLNIINANTFNSGSQSDYRAMRFGLTSALLSDGYYSFDYGDQNHGQLWYYDEYDIDLGPGNGAPQASNGGSNFSADVWQRSFDHGVAVVNSTGARQTVELGGEFEKITGVQDPSVNDGSIVSETTVDAFDGQVLLKTFDVLEGVVFENGAFARFLRPDGSRVRNGFFVFEGAQRGGVQIARIDMNGNNIPELIVATHNRLSIWRDDGQLYMRAWPYTANYTGGLHIAIGDITGNNKGEVIVAPAPGYPAPLKIYTRHGIRLGHDWYPFGQRYTNGYSIDTADIFGSGREDIVLSGKSGEQPRVRLYRFLGGGLFNMLHNWLAYESSFRGGIDVAAGDIDDDEIDEIIVGAGPGKPPLIRIFNAQGQQLHPEFQAYQSLGRPGIDVGSTDVNFDGKDDILGFSTGIGL